MNLASHRGRYQLRSPSSAITDGSSTARITVASISTEIARPTASCLNCCTLSVPNTENTATMMIAALVTTPAVDRIPYATASRVGQAAVMPLPDPGHDEHVVVHGQPEQHDEHEQRYPRLDRAGAWVPTSAAPQPCTKTALSAPYAAPTESRLSTIEVAAITSEPNEIEHQHEGDAHDEQDHRHDAARHLVVPVEARARSPPTSAVPPGILPDGGGHDRVVQRRQGLPRGGIVPRPGERDVDLRQVRRGVHGDVRRLAERAAAVAGQGRDLPLCRRRT